MNNTDDELDRHLNLDETVDELFSDLAEELEDPGEQKANYKRKFHYSETLGYPDDYNWPRYMLEVRAAFEHRTPVANVLVRHFGATFTTIDRDDGVSEQSVDKVEMELACVLCGHVSRHSVSIASIAAGDIGDKIAMKRILRGVLLTWKMKGELCVEAEKGKERGCYELDGRPRRKMRTVSADEERMEHKVQLGTYITIRMKQKIIKIIGRRRLAGISDPMNKGITWVVGEALEQWVERQERELEGKT